MFKKFAFDDFEKKNLINNTIFCNFSVIFDFWTFVSVNVYVLYKLSRFLIHLTNFYILFMLPLNFFIVFLWILRKVFAINFFFLWSIFRHYYFIVFFKWDGVEIFKICWYKRRRLWIFAHVYLHSSIYLNLNCLINCVMIVE